MKRTFTLAALWLALSVGAEAQNITIASGRSYTAADTTSWVALQPLRPYSLVFWAKDSVNVTITAQLGSDSSKTVFWTYAVVSDSTNSTTDAGYQKGFLLRNASTDNIPAASRIRLIVTPKTTRNGTSSATYSAWLEQQ